ncbi:hypothetical protein ACQPT2_17445 [Erwinia amylovora]
MSQHLTEKLTFRPASEKPTAEMDDKDVLVYNPCDGWHEGTIHTFEEDGEIYDVGIYCFLMDEMTPHDFYVAWALLPEHEKIDKQFAAEKRRPFVDIILRDC